MVRKIQRAVNTLPPFSPVLRRVLATLTLPDDEISIPSIAADVQRDTVIAGRLLGVANSALYNRGVSIHSIPHAVARLGLARVRNVLLGLSVNRLWAGMKVPDEFSMLRFNQHALAAATMADLLAQQGSVTDGDEAFVAGLFHDVGQLVLMHVDPVQYTTTLRDIPYDGPELGQREKELFGLTHADVSAIVTACWNLPQSTQAAVRDHERASIPEGVTEYQLSEIVHAADRYVVASGWSVTDYRNESNPEEILSSLGVDPAGTADDFLLQFRTLCAA